MMRWSLNILATAGFRYSGSSHPGFNEHSRPRASAKFAVQRSDRVSCAVAHRSQPELKVQRRGSGVCTHQSAQQDATRTQGLQHQRWHTGDAPTSQLRALRSLQVRYTGRPVLHAPARYRQTYSTPQLLQPRHHCCCWCCWVMGLCVATQLRAARLLGLWQLAYLCQQRLEASAKLGQADAPPPQRQQCPAGRQLAASAFWTQAVADVPELWASVPSCLCWL